MTNAPAGGSEVEAPGKLGATCHAGAFRGLRKRLLKLIPEQQRLEVTAFASNRTHTALGMNEKHVFNQIDKWMAAIRENISTGVPVCGTCHCEIAVDDAFCRHCGAKVMGLSQDSPAAATVPNIEDAIATAVHERLPRESQRSADHNPTPPPLPGGYASRDKGSPAESRIKWGRMALALALFGMVMGGLYFIEAASLNGRGDSNGGEATQQVAPIQVQSGKHDIKGFTVGMRWPDVKARLSSMTPQPKCQEETKDLSQSPFAPQGRTFPEAYTVREITCQLSDSTGLIFFIRPLIDAETVQWLAFAYQDRQDSIAVQIARVRSQFGVGTPTPCVLPGFSQCFDWKLDDGQPLRFASDGLSSSLFLLTPPWLDQKNLETFQTKAASKPGLKF